MPLIWFLYRDSWTSGSSSKSKNFLRSKEAKRRHFFSYLKREITLLKTYKCSLGQWPGLQAIWNFVMFLNIVSFADVVTTKPKNFSSSSLSWICLMKSSSPILFLSLLSCIMVDSNHFAGIFYVSQTMLNKWNIADIKSNPAFLMNWYFLPGFS